MNIWEFVTNILFQPASLAVLGAALAVILPGWGSAKAVGFCGEAVAGLMSEDPSKFGKALVLNILPATQGIYGFLLSVMKISALPVAGAVASEGWKLFGAAVALGATGLASALLQGKTAASCICAIGKNGQGSGKYVLFPAMIEFYAILALVLGIML